MAVLMAEGEVLVKHTHDLELAEQLARTLLAEENLESDERTPEALAAFRLGTSIVGHFRVVPCLPGSYGEGEGWAWELHRARGPGRGAFPAVEFLP